MASIQTSIQLVDRISAPVNNMVSALDSMCQAFENVERSMDNSFDTAPIHAARQSIEQAAQQVNQLGQEQDNYTQAVQRSASSADGLLGKIGQLIAAYATIQTAGKLLDMSDELASTTARLDMMNDGLQSTDDLVKMVYASAQNARGSFTDMAAVVAKFGNNAKDAFSSSEEVVQFANLIQKQMTIAGASTAEASNAMLQLSQALGSGVLRGDELNSIFEQAPNLIQSIADYLDVPIGQIRSMAQKGQLSADVVKQAIFASADSINEKFEQMPMTWSQLWTSMGNTALMQLQPLLNQLNEIANNEDFQIFAANAVGAVAMIGSALLGVFEVVASIAGFVSDNWSVIEPIVIGIIAAIGLYTAALLLNNTIQAISAMVTGVKAAAEMMSTGATFAATAAQYGFNAALMACPITWIVLAVIALIAALVAVCAWIAKTTGATNSAFGVITGGINVVIQFFKNLGLIVANIALGIWNALGACASNVGTAFHNAISGVQSWFYNLLSTALKVVEGICAALNKLPFVEFDYSGISNAASDYAAKATESAGNKEDYKSVSDAFSAGMSTFDTFQNGWASNAFSAGAAWGDGVANSVSNMFGTDGIGVDTSSMFKSGGYDASQIPGNIASTADNTGKAADSLEITSEDLKYLNDIAEREVVNRFTTAEIKVEMGGVTNNVTNNTDLDGMVDYLTTSLNEAMEAAAEGVHN